MSDLDYAIDLRAVASGFDGRTFWGQARAGAIPGDGDAPPTVVLTAQPTLRSGSDIFFALSEWRSSDLGETWDPEPRARGYFVPLRAGLNEQLMYSTSVRDGTPVHRSTDGGLTWEAVGDDLPAPAFGADNLGLDPLEPEVLVYAGNLSGGNGALFRSEDAGESWERVAALPSVPRRVRAL